ncbi:MAG: hypothetical protein L0Y58_21590 [Verrucomicrobia subdivision 3 bacterium]|nr:hypothetical protein [Limisphaerales bacterium]
MQRPKADGSGVQVRMGSGPTGPSVTIHYTVVFKARATGRTFSVEAFATDDFGNEQGFDPVGTINVLPR